MKTDSSKGKTMKSVSLAIISIGEGGGAEEAGSAFADVMKAHNHRIESHVKIMKDTGSIQKSLREAMEDFDVHAIACIGGIGISDDDITIEALEDYVEKEMPGFGELFRSLHYEESGTASMVYRAMAFVSEKKIIFVLPDAPSIVRIAAEKLIAHEIGHLVQEARGDA